jgi:hypothetical protein
VVPSAPPPPPPPPVVTTSAPPAPPVITSSAPPPPNPSNTCACDYAGALQDRALDKRGGGGGAHTCACPAAPKPTSVIAPTNTCACDYAGSLPGRDLKERTDGPKTCACGVQPSKTLAAKPCPPEHREGSLQERGGDQCLSGAVPDGAAIVEAPNERESQANIILFSC